MNRKKKIKNSTPNPISISVGTGYNLPLSILNCSIDDSIARGTLLTTNTNGQLELWAEGSCPPDVTVMEDSDKHYVIGNYSFPVKFDYKIVYDIDYPQKPDKKKGLELLLSRAK